MNRRGSFLLAVPEHLYLVPLSIPKQLLPVHDKPI